MPSLGVYRIWEGMSYFLMIFPNRPPRSLPAPEAEEEELLPPSREPSTLPMLLPAEAWGPAVRQDIKAQGQKLHILHPYFKVHRGRGILCKQAEISYRTGIPLSYRKQVIIR